MKQGLSDYVDYFLYTVKQIEVAKTTFVGYENICKNIKAYFVHRTLDEIKKETSNVTSNTYPTRRSPSTPFANTMTC